MKFRKSPIALAALALCSAMPLAANAQTTTPTPAPLSGSLDVWFKAPLAGATISGPLNGGTSCYTSTSGSVAKVAFKMDSTALNTDTTPADGTQCVIDTTKFANGAHTLTATVSDSSGNTRNDVISVNVQNSGSTPSPTPTPSASLPAGGKAVTTFHSAGLYWTPTSNPGSAGCTVQYKKSSDSTWSQGLSLWYDSNNNECRGSIVQ